MASTHAAKEFETALREYFHDMTVFSADAAVEAGWRSEVRQLIGSDAGMALEIKTLTDVIGILTSLPHTNASSSRR